MPFYFTLRKRNKRIAEKYIQDSLKKREKQENIIQKWVTGESNFDKTTHLEVWENYRKSYGDRMLHQVLKSMAIGNALVDVNHILQYNLAMPQAVIEQGPVVATVGKLFNVELATLLLSDTKLDDKAKEEILYRVIARDFPLKHEKVPANPVPVQSPIPQMPNLPLPPPRRSIRRGEQ